MPFFLDSRETNERFGKQMSELQSFFDVNHVIHGSPEDFFEFAKTLEHSNQLRIDLSGFIKSIMKKEREELLLTDMMSIIAASVGGPSFAETDEDLTEPTNSLMEFLLGTGCWRQFGSPPPPAASAAPSTRTSARVEERRKPREPQESPVPGKLREPREPRKPRFSRASPVSTVDESRIDQPGSLDASGELRQTLSRLEINTLAVKLHLESIEQRISKIEPSDVPPALDVQAVQPPAPEAIPAEPSEPEIPVVPIAHSPASPVSPPVSPPMSQPWSSPPPEPVLHRRGGDSVSRYSSEAVPSFGTDFPSRGRAMFSHPPVEPEPDDFDSPTFSYASEKGRSNITIGVFLALVAIVAGFLFFAHSQQGKALLQAGMSRLKDARALVGSGSEAVNGRSTSTLPPLPASAPAPAPESSSPPVVSAPLPPASPATDTPTTSTSTPPASAAPADAAPAQPAAVETTADTAAPGTRTTSDIHKFLYVQSNLMRSHLLSAPDPVSPPDGRGTVVMQIVVSKTGSVETVRVIKGPEGLRNAAVNAVRNWRYSPYVVDGRPMDIATTVYINFH